MHEILTNRSIIEIYGDDAMKFLQNLTTNDIKAADYCYTYMLSNQGRYLFDFFVFMESEIKFLIDINKNNLDLFKSHLVKYKLRAKMEINDLSDIYQVLYSKQRPEFTTIISRQDPRYNLLGFRSIIRKGISQFKEKNELYLSDKYSFAVVDGYEDLIYDKSIPIEYGAEELRSISYNKGCYVGQEIISRTKYQGVVRKKIYKLSSPINLTYLSKGDKIVADDIIIGTICSTYKNNAIALIKENEYFALQKATIMVGTADISLSVPPWR